MTISPRASLKDVSQLEPPPFACRRCGRCCQGRGGVWLDRAGVRAAAEVLGLPPERFEAGFLRPGPGGLWTLETGANGFCRCWEPESRRCLIHAAKPLMCQDWPLFCSLLADEEVFCEARRFCPGLDEKSAWARFVAWGRRRLGDRQPPRSYRAWLDPSFRS